VQPAGQLISAAPIAMTKTGTSGSPAPITQAHPTGYPLYRLEWQSLGSLQRRLRACMSGIRAQAYDYGAPELVELELYLMSGRGMPMEARRCGLRDPLPPSWEERECL